MLLGAASGGGDPCSASQAPSTTISPSRVRNHTPPISAASPRDQPRTNTTTLRRHFTYLTPDTPRRLPRLGNISTKRTSRFAYLVHTNPHPFTSQNPPSSKMLIKYEILPSISFRRGTSSSGSHLINTTATLQSPNPHGQRNRTRHRIRVQGASPCASHDAPRLAILTPREN